MVADGAHGRVDFLDGNAQALLAVFGAAEQIALAHDLHFDLFHESAFSV